MIPVYFIISPVENSDNSIRIRFDEIINFLSGIGTKKIVKEKIVVKFTHFPENMNFESIMGLVMEAERLAIVEN